MKKILLVDDKMTIGKILTMYLGKEYEIVYQDNALDAIEWLNKGEEPKLIITDIHMPNMDGVAFVSYLKQNELWKHIPVVVLSSEDNSQMRIKLFEIGADDYILKPFNPVELKARVKRYLV